MAEIIKHRLVHPTEGHRMSRVYVEGKGWYGRKPRQPHTVFLACLHFDHEGFEIVGVCRTYEAASEALSRVMNTGRTFDRTSIDEYTVEE